MCRPDAAGGRLAGGVRVLHTGRSVRRRLGLTISLTLTLMAGATGRAQAQDSRAAIIEAEQAEKAKTLKPYAASGAEKAIVTLQREFLRIPTASIRSSHPSTAAAASRWAPATGASTAIGRMRI